MAGLNGISWMGQAVNVNAAKGQSKKGKSQMREALTEQSFMGTV